MAARRSVIWHRGRKALPYAFAFVAGSYFFYLASVLEFSAPHGRIGPEFWPKMILGALLATCAYEIGRILLFHREPYPNDTVISAAAERDLPQEAVPAGTTRRVVAGVAAAFAYVFLLNKSGFLLTTFVFLVVFNYLGGYQRHVVIWLSSLIASVLLMFVFMRIVYISLPLGVAPFSAVSEAAISVLGIR